MMISFTLFSMDAASSLKVFHEYKTEKDVINHPVLESGHEYIHFYVEYKGCLKGICIYA